jgi:hypothetical protein
MPTTADHTFEYREDSGHTETLTATTPDEALAQAQKLLRTGSYGTITKTLRLHARVTESGLSLDDVVEELDAWRVTVLLEPQVPPCTGMDHKWDNGHSACNDGGVTVTHQCTTCGLRSVLNTYDSCPDCGERYESTTYQPAEPGWDDEPGWDTIDGDGR